MIMNNQPHLPGVSRAVKHEVGGHVDVFTECFFCGEVFETEYYDSICPGCAYDCTEVEWVEDL